MWLSPHSFFAPIGKSFSSCSKCLKPSFYANNGKNYTQARCKMTEHYYSTNPGVESNRQEFSYTLRGNTFTFISDSGVFSKKEVDFGSRLLIEAFQPPAVEGDILDMGCGYGPIGISIAASEKDRKVCLVDINERAIELAKENAHSNKISNLEIYQSDLFSKVKGTYAAILTNPPIRAGKKVVHTIFEDAFDYLKDSGELWVVIQKKQGAPSALEKLKSLFKEVDVVEKKKGYYIIKGKKV